MMYKLLFLFLLFFETTGHSQVKGDLTLRFGVDRQDWSMTEMNDLITNTSLIQIGQLNTPRENTFENGMKITGSFGYQFSRLWEGGFTSSFQQGNCVHYDGYLIPNTTGTYDTFDVNINYLSRTQSLGLYSRMSINNLLNWDNKGNLTDRLMLGLNFSCAYGFTSFESTRTVLFEQETIAQDVFYTGKANSILASIGIDAGWLLSKSELISSIGFNFGYQYFRTPDLSNRTGTQFMGSGESVGVDLSGIYFGGFLKLGK